MFESLIEAAYIYDFEIDNLCMFANNVMAEKWNLSFDKAHTQLEEHLILQHNVKVENRGSLAHSDEQKQEEAEKDASIF